MNVRFPGNKKLWPFLVACGIVISPAVFADVYRCQGTDGKVVYSDKPCTGKEDQKVLDGRNAQYRDEANKRRAEMAQQQAQQVEEAKALGTVLEGIAQEIRIAKTTLVARRGTDTDLAKLLELNAFWDETAKLASSTARIALAAPVARLQDIKYRARAIDIRPCYEPAKRALLSKMDTRIETMLAFMRQEETAVTISQLVELELERNFLVTLASSCTTTS